MNSLLTSVAAKNGTHAANNSTDARNWLAKLCGFEQMTRNKGVAAYVVDVTPEIAAKFLEMNFERNRSLRNPSLTRFKRLLIADAFFDGSAIRIAQKGDSFTLTDGQHRLWAIFESGLAATMVVIVTDADAAEDYSKVDTGGQLRSAADTTAALDASGTFTSLSRTSQNAFMASLRWIAGGFGRSMRERLYTPAEYSTLAIEWQPELQKIMGIVGSSGHMGMGSLTRGIFKAPVLAVALITAKYVKAELVSDFWGQVSRDDGLRTNDPRKRLHNRLREASPQGGKTQLQNAVAAATCWNYFVDGKELDKLYTNKEMPKIALTPYPLPAEVEAE
jgi:hypothetical protein